MATSTLAPLFAGRRIDRNRSKAASQDKASLEKQPYSLMSSLVHALRQGLKRRAAIRALGALDERLLADIGIDRDNIEAETDAMLARSQGGED